MNIAQANVATMITGYDDPLMADFMEELDIVNATADETPGFVWRFVEDDDGAEVAGVFGDDKLLFNMSVWGSVEALETWAYSGRHLDVVRKRTKWFEKPTRPPLALWWIDNDHIPTVKEARDRFHLLWEQGPTADAFTFRSHFPPP